MSIRLCKKCGFILGARPNSKEVEGVCLACINVENKNKIDFAGRQQWLSEFIDSKKNPSRKYDCMIAVSGGKDSHMIVSRLVDNHKIGNALLVTVGDEYSLSGAGIANRKNIAENFSFDHIVFRNNPMEFRERSLEGFVERLNPQAWFEDTLYDVPINLARQLGIPLVFFGENSAYEYGSSDELGIFHPRTTEAISVIFMGAIYPYSIGDSLDVARRHGFKDLDSFDDWYRMGGVESSTQIDSIGNMVDIWCKFPKFGFQRASDISCRLVREGVLTKEQAARYIQDNDYILDPKAKHDFCKVLGITKEFFDEIVDKHANLNVVKKDVNGVYRRIDMM